MNSILPDKDGNYIIEDMIYSEDQYKWYFGTEEEMELARNAEPWVKSKWPNGELPYKISDEIDSYHNSEIRRCMNEFNQHFQGCINVR